MVDDRFSFQNNAEIDSAENDANLSNNFSSVITTVTGNCSLLQS